MSSYFKIPTSLTIPNGVKIIGKNAFASCSELEKVVISEGVEKIGICSFYECWWLKKVVIPKSVEFIGAYAFYDCKNADVVINKSSEKDFKYLGYRALNDCFMVSYVKEETRN